MKCTYVGIGAALLLAASSAMAEPAASSNTYSMEYAVVSASGSEATGGQYSVMARVQTEGVMGTPPSSATYSVAPLVGSTSADAAVTDWTLY